jgi:[acyl-carrier-protein] S-malonyltransferase
MLIITAPGQGSQTPGFLAPWLDVPGVAERLGAYSELAGLDLIRFGTTASADEIKDTAVAQPLLVAAALAAAGALAGSLTGSVPGSLAEPGEVRADAAAGHSVGELAAGAVAGVLGADDAMRLVGVRGTAMAAASAIEPTGMTAVLGGDEEGVLAAIARHGLTPANVNGAGQIVAAGTLADLEAFAADPPAGARLRPLQVAGAFHTRHMAPAVAALREAAADVSVTDPAITLLSDADGAAVTTGKEWLERVIAQVAAPVRWDLCLKTMADLGVTALIELPPAGTLTGLARRALPGIAQLAIKTPDQLDAARDLIQEHLSQPDDHDHLPEWRLVVASTSGTFRTPTGRTDSTATGAMVALTAELGTVVARGGEHLVSAPEPAEIIEWLVEDGDPVSEGQPLVRILPKGGPGGWVPPEGDKGGPGGWVPPEGDKGGPGGWVPPEGKDGAWRR